MKKWEHARFDIAWLQLCEGVRGGGKEVASDAGGVAGGSEVELECR